MPRPLPRAALAWALMLVWMLSRARVLEQMRRPARVRQARRALSMILSPLRRHLAAPPQWPAWDLPGRIDCRSRQVGRQA